MISGNETAMDPLRGVVGARKRPGREIPKGSGFQDRIAGVPGPGAAAIVAESQVPEVWREEYDLCRPATIQGLPPAQNHWSCVSSMTTLPG